LFQGGRTTRGTSPPRPSPPRSAARRSGRGQHPDTARARRVADAWCAAFLGPKTADAEPVTHSTLTALADGTAPDSVIAAVDALATRHRLFHWHLEFPDVLTVAARVVDRKLTGWDGGFHAVLGNPPWIAHAGRAAQPLPKGVGGLLEAINPAFGGYRATHSAFIRRAAECLGSGGRLALIVPTSVSDLDGYLPARRAHDQLARAQEPLMSFGDGAFTGVFQPCMALVSVARVSIEKAAAGDEWLLRRPELTERAAGLLAHFGNMERFPPALFGELGFQTDRYTKSLLRPAGDATAADTFILEGKDIEEYRLRGVGHCLPTRVLGAQRARQQAVTLVVRQTARFPIAAPVAGMAFRNSLIAVMPDDEWSRQTLLGLLNSRVVRWFHYNRFRDAREGMPQLKVGHLRKLPRPQDCEAADEIAKDVDRLLLTRGRASNEVREAIEARVYAAYGLDLDQQQEIESWWRSFRFVRRPAG